MKHYLKLALCAIAAIGLASCQNDDLRLENVEIVDKVHDGEIILGVADGSIDMNVSTKATAITSIPGNLNVSRTTGTWKSETTKNASASKKVSSGKIATGWYQTATATAYNYYVSNAAITFAAGGSTVSADNGTDVIAGCTQGANNTTSPSVTLDHVFARSGSLAASAPSGYEISGVSWKIKSKSGGTGGTKGTYNIATKAWSGVTALAEQAFTASSDLYLTPGEYTISVTYTLTKGDYSDSTTKSADVTFVAGKVNNISTTVPVIGDGAADINLSLTLTAWGTENLTPTFN